jgi:hypothetical protein
MRQLGSSLDQYARRARLYPALLAALPLPIALVAALPVSGAALAPLWALVSWCGAGFLLAQLGRDLGKAKEQTLFDKWEGKPTTQLLRHRDAANPIWLAQVHHSLQSLLPQLELPTQEQESEDQKRADAAYDAAVIALREATRDKDAFPLVYEESCSYGFRRNLWGLKPIGITLGIACLSALLSLLVIGQKWHPADSPLIWAALTTMAALLLLWTTVIKPSWVRAAAFAYAERLIASASTLAKHTEP